MRVARHRYDDGVLVAESVTNISFDDARRGEHTATPLLLKPVKTAEHSIFEMKLFLQSDGGLSQSSFGGFTSDVFVPGVNHTNCLSNHFSLASGVTGWPVSGANDSGLSIPCASGIPTGYIWLDANIGEHEATGPSSLNYRFLYDYN